MLLLQAQPLSVPLQDSLRFFHIPLPAPHSACLATRLLAFDFCQRETGLPRSV